MVLNRSLKIPDEKTLLEEKLNSWFSRAKNHLIDIPASLDNQVKLLSKMRLDIYEDLNQLQHEAALIAVAERLQAEFEPDEWKWHPRQTSNPSEADLTGLKNGIEIINAEVTTSLSAKGIIDSRMRNTLISINSKSGSCFYYVLSDEMLRRAETKKRNLQLNKVVVRKL